MVGGKVEGREEGEKMADCRRLALAVLGHSGTQAAVLAAVSHRGDEGEVLGWSCCR